MEYSKILIFNLQNQEYGIEIEYVERIIGENLITSVADSEEFIDTVMHYTNETLTVLNLAKLFSKGKYDKVMDSKIVVVVSDGVRVGIRVDSVTDVLKIKKSLLNYIPNIVIKSNENKIKGLIKSEGTIKILLDTKKKFKNINITVVGRY